ncbi:hypothetical protein FJZ20_01635 [Candidatus Pacearchaeota archaeon]|nr:hypothetical protein [Candidatus Pacearchaeota archaeon]
MAKKIKYVKIEAENNYEFGFKLGKALSRNIKRRIRKNKKIYRRKGISYSQMMKGAKKFIPAIKKKYPLLLEELRGMSVGSKVPFEDLLVMQCEEELLDFYVEKCTSLAVKTKNGEIYLGHNEDWLKEYLNNGMVVVSGRIGKLKFLSLTYMGALVGASCSLNYHGLAFTGNSLDFKRFRFGIPRNFSLRAILSTRNIKEAEKIIESKKQSIASNTLLVFKNTMMEDIERLWISYDVFHGHKWIVHTNNPLVKSEQNKSNTDPESVKRCKRAYEILSKKKSVTIETLKEVLRDHETGICGHYHRKHPTYGVTIASAIINPREQWIEVCHSNPCKHRYIRYNLK